MPMNDMKSRILLTVLFLFVLPLTGSAAQGPYTLRLQAYTTTSAEQPYLAVLTLTPDHGWHAYGPVQGPSGFPTAVTGTVDNTAVQALYPPPVAGPDPLDPTKTVELYDGDTPVFIPLPGRQPVELKLRLKALLCSDTTCQPVRAEPALSFNATMLQALPMAEEQPWWPQFQSIFGQHEHASPQPSGLATTTETAPKSEPAAPMIFTPRAFAPGLEVHTLGKAAALAFLAGLILNFMPCVLPVITLKLRSFIPVADSMPVHQRQDFRAHNLFFALGMLVYFLILAAIIAMTGMAWGQIFQQPSSIITLTAIVFALSLSLFGVYDLPLIDLKGKTRGVKHHPHLESFITGVLTTVLATPCSGPFLGGVLAWALIQPPQIIALVLGCIGLGMASPYLAMAMFPVMYRLLPRPGAWTTKLERFLGFLLAGTTVYLIGLLPESLYLDVLILLWVIALGAWIWGRWTSLNQPRQKRWGLRGLALLLIGLTAAGLFADSRERDPWQPFVMAEFKAELGHRDMVLDFTADWCPNCKFLEKTVLKPENMLRLSDKYGMELRRVDLTRNDPELMQLLNSLGSQSIPVLAIFSKDRPDSPLIMRDLFTLSQLEKALQQELYKEN